MNHLWRVPCWAKPLKIWLSRATQMLFLFESQAWPLTAGRGWNTLKGPSGQSPPRWPLEKAMGWDLFCGVPDPTREPALCTGLSWLYSFRDQRRRDWPGRRFIQPEVWHWLLGLEAAQEQEEEVFSQYSQWRVVWRDWGFWVTSKKVLNPLSAHTQSIRARTAKTSGPWEALKGGN